MNTQTWLTGPPPATGQRQRYPGRFILNLKKNYPSVFSPDANVLEMFAGSCAVLGAVTTDLREETGCDFPSPYDNLPFDDNSFDFVVADPPYTKGFAREWTSLEAEIPKPKHILKEASRVVKPGGMIFILHVIVIPAYKIFNVSRVALHPILCGPNNAIRVLNVLENNK